jgi:NAD-dependent SIR2 family protein deacetylase
VDLASVQPTAGHRALSQLIDDSLCQMVLSTNVDGLHLKSGLAPAKLIELHGSSFRERCEKCHREYLRDFPVSSAVQTAGTTEAAVDHRTGRLCDCGGALRDTIVQFGEALVPAVEAAAWDVARKGNMREEREEMRQIRAASKERHYSLYAFSVCSGPCDCSWLEHESLSLV